MKLHSTAVWSELPLLQDLTISVGGEAANLFRQANTEAFMTQHVMGKGPLTLMDSAEVRHWMNQACMAVQAAATAAMRASIDQLAQSGLKAPASNTFSVRLLYPTWPNKTVHHVQLAVALLWHLKPQNRATMISFHRVYIQ